MQIRDAVNTALGLMRQGRWSDAIGVLQDVLTERVDDATVIMLLGTCFRMLNSDGLAYVLLMRSIELKEDNFDAMVNLAGILREMGLHDAEVGLWDACRKLRPDDPILLHNVAGCYLNNGTPEIAEEHARKAIEQSGDKPDTLIQLGLALLEQEKFGEGFDTWDKALKIGKGERKHRNFWTLGQTPFWDGTPGQNVVVYGEQGHGDELMFASCMGEVFSRSKQVFLDTSKRDLVPLYERSFPEAIVFCTPDSQENPHHAEHQIDAMIPFGSLPTLFRRKRDDFPELDGYIKPHEAKCVEMRRRLDALGPGLKIGLAWRGGIKKTHSVYRNIALDRFWPIIGQENAHFISVQYGPEAAEAANEQQDITGVPVHHWQGVTDDFDYLTALINEVDLVISVPQTAVHQRAALGKECWVLTPEKPPWTFGQSGEDSVWYPKHVRQFRQNSGEGNNWTPCIMRVAQALTERTGSKPGPVHIPEKTSNEFELQRGAV